MMIFSRRQLFSITFICLLLSLIEKVVKGSADIANIGHNGGSVLSQSHLVKNRGNSDSALIDSEKFTSRKRKDGDEDDEDEKNSKGLKVTTAVLFPKLLKNGLYSFLGTTVVMYVLNQKHMLPRSLSSFVSRKLFWPTLPITASRRFKNWYTVIDDNVVLGGLPLGFMNIPERLHKHYNIKGVINMCEEYKGPLRKYKEMDIEELWLPTTDHYEPTTDDIKEAVKFIKKFESKGRVYVHCRAGHGRSAAIVYAYLLSKDSNVGMEDLNVKLSKLRNVRKKLWKQKHLIEYQLWLRQKGNSDKTE